MDLNSLLSSTSFIQCTDSYTGSIPVLKLRSQMLNPYNEPRNEEQPKTFLGDSNSNVSYVSPAGDCGSSGPAFISLVGDCSYPSPNPAFISLAGDCGSSGPAFISPTGDCSSESIG